jgi:hypothetical protein
MAWLSFFDLIDSIDSIDLIDKVGFALKNTETVLLSTP